MKYKNIEIIPIPKSVLEDCNGLTQGAKMMYIEWFSELYLGRNNIKEHIRHINDLGLSSTRESLENLIDSGYIDLDKCELKITTDYIYDTHYGVFIHK